MERKDERIRNQDEPSKVRTEEPLEQGKRGDQDRMSERETPPNPAQRKHDDDDLVRSER